MAEHRYMVTIQKPADGNALPAKFVSAANAISYRPAELYKWLSGNAYDSDTDMITIFGTMSILFRADATPDLIQMLVRSISDKSQLRVDAKTIIYDGRQFYNGSQELDVLCRVSSVLPSTGGGYIFNFTGVNEARRRMPIPQRGGNNERTPPHFS